MDFIFHTLGPRVTPLNVWKSGSSKLGGPRTMYAPLLLNLSPELCMVEKNQQLGCIINSQTTNANNLFIIIIILKQC